MRVCWGRVAWGQEVAELHVCSMDLFSYIFDLFIINLETNIYPIFFPGDALCRATVSRRARAQYLGHGVGREESESESKG